MKIELPHDQQVFLEQLVKSGRFASTDEAISECVRLMVSRETLRDQVAAGIEQADRDEVTDHETVFADLRTRVSDLQSQ